MFSGPGKGGVFLKGDRKQAPLNTEKEDAKDSLFRGGEEKNIFESSAGGNEAEENIEERSHWEG